jgi:RNA polymerase sigma-70 factor (ECF subfamily)
MVMATTTPEQATILVARAKAGDRSAFAELYRRYRNRILALTLHLTGNENDAEDVTQEVFLRAYKKLDSFEGRSHFFTWVYRMAVNRALNAKRDKKRRREAVLDDPRIERALTIDSNGDPERETELRRTYSLLLAALDKLPASMRTSVVLVTLQGLSHQEAAIVQQCSPGTIAWRIHEARSRLRKSLTPKRAPLPRKAKKQRLSSELTRLLNVCGLPVPLPSPA